MKRSKILCNKLKLNKTNFDLIKLGQRGENHIFMKFDGRRDLHERTII